MAVETRGAGQEGGRDGVGDRGASEGTLYHYCGRRSQVHGCPKMETLSDKVTGIPVFLLPTTFMFVLIHCIVLENIVG